MRISTQIAEVRTEIDALDTRLSTQIADLRTEQRTDIAGVRTGIAIPNPSPGPRPAPQPHARSPRLVVDPLLLPPTMNARMVR